MNYPAASCEEFFWLKKTTIRSIQILIIQRVKVWKWVLMDVLSLNFMVQKWHTALDFLGIVTNVSTKAEGVVHFYNGRGIAEQWIKERKYALNWTRLSCKRFLSNQVSLWLFVIVYNLWNFLRRLVLSGKINHWSLHSLLTKLIKIGAKVVRHSRYITFQMLEIAIKRSYLLRYWLGLNDYVIILFNTLLSDMNQWIGIPDW